MTAIRDDDDETRRPAGPTDGDGDGGDGGDDDIEILEVSALDEAGVRLPTEKKAKKRKAAAEDVEIDVETDGFDDAVGAAPAARASDPAKDQQIQELREQLMRTAADFENFRKRIDRDRVEERKQATAGIVRNLVPVLDSLHRALEQAGRVEEPSTKAFADGVRLIETQLFDILKSAGLQPVDASGAFDPMVHEALMQETTTEAPHMSVLEVFEPGYMLGSRLIRPARVKVANNPASASGGGPASASGGGPGVASGGGGEASDEDREASESQSVTEP